MKRLLSLLVVAVMLLQSVSTAQEANAAKKVKLNKTSITLEAGKSQTLKVTGTKKKVKWKSAKKSIASVSNKGKVTAKKVGKTTITATVGKKTLKCKVTVVDNSSSEAADTSENNTVVDKPTSEDIPLDDSVDINNFDKNDVKVLKALIKDLRSRTGFVVSEVSEDLTSNQYVWEDGKLRSINWENCSLSGELSTAGLDNLKELKVGGTNLTKLDVSKNVNLTNLDCRKNHLTQLDVSKNVNLTVLCCSQNSLTQLDVSKNVNLENLTCFGNGLTQLDVSKNTALKDLICWENQLTQLDVSKNVNLTNLDCCSNQLTQLDVSKNVNLTGLNCCSNQLTQLDVSECVNLGGYDFECDDDVEVIRYRCEF